MNATALKMMGEERLAYLNEQRQRIEDIASLHDPKWVSKMLAYYDRQIEQLQEAMQYISDE